MSVKKFAIISIIVFVITVPVLSQSQEVSEIQDISSSDFLVQGFEAYQRNDWPSALLYLRKAASLPQTSTEEVWYMLVMSQMYAQDYESVIKDSDFFIQVFPGSTLCSFVEYQKGRALHYLGKYEESIRVLGDFCTQYESHELYPAALFWIAESLYVTYYYDLALSLYERIIVEFPQSSKSTESFYRIDVISQREKEEKLLYLLKVTGEEYLSSKEEYERQLKQYQTEESIGLRKQLNESLARLRELEAAIAEAEQVTAMQKEKIAELNKTADELRAMSVKVVEPSSLDLERKQSIVDLKKKAGEVQQALDVRQGE